MESRGLVAWNLRKLRVAKGLSQEALAFKAGISRAYLSRLERSVENATLDLIDRLAVALSVKTAALFTPRVPGERRSSGLPAGRKPPSKRKHPSR
jgi:transcriptional regulator with XRE-family HTH domain